MTRPTFLLALISALSLIGCGGAPEGGAENELPLVVVTSTMAADMVSQIAGPEFVVNGLIPAGVDPHTYELPARATGLLRSADGVVYNGLHLEGKMSEVFAPLASQGVRVLELGRSVPEGRLITAADFDIGSSDPHIWGDASLWAEAIPAVVSLLSEIMPEKAPDFASRGNTYAEEILALDRWVHDQITTIPEANRTLITSHDAFSYFGRAYGVEVIGIQGVSTASESGMADLINMKDLVKERGVKALFVESSVSRANIEAVAKDADVGIGGVLYSDSCGPAGLTETIDGEEYDVGTYIGMMKHNVVTIVDALK